MKEILILTGLIAGLLIWFFSMSAKEEARWRSWASEHNCVVIREEGPSTGFGTGITSDGKMAFVPIFISGKTAYRCDDGKEYVR